MPPDRVALFLTAHFPAVYTQGMNSQYITALPDDWERVAQVFSAMGDATRQRILLLFEPGEQIGLSTLVATVGMSRTAVSHHVNVLVRAGLLIPRRIGKEVVYRRDLPFAVAMLDRVRDYALSELAAEKAARQDQSPA